ncbi:uncharacterized protein EV420DRAFT_1723762 [Desarmillaria tabescens]|uniref:Uncharacterized protein n=1 Tax=Armillaria tabescens TaxID=1929756 RepID=A0AA39MRU3_ARMTA|nr:uncharacterized protein EV420DRAFT_1723762 [Desarmillaria tabescens]KAK0443689.1 hypothetical protein EV420DRAFT_1723762 [Desarmillaria tabescens]
MDGEEDSAGGNTHNVSPTTPTKTKNQVYAHLNETPRANRGHMSKKFAAPDNEDRPRAVPSRDASPTPSNTSTGSKRGRQDDEDVFYRDTNHWSNEMEKDDGERDVALLREQLEITIEAARRYASNRARASEGDLAELAQTLISELTMFVSPEKTLSTEVMIRRVYSKQEMMEKKMEQFECMQIELERRERKSSEEMDEEVRTSLPIQDYAAVTANTPRGGNTMKAPTPQYTAKTVRPTKPTTQSTTTPTKPMNPNKAYNPCRMVVRAPELPIDYERPRPESVAIRVNEELAKHDETKAFVIVHVRFNANNSCILNLRSDQRATDLEPHANIFKHVVFPGRETVEAYPDEKWFSVHICGVRTGIIDGPDGDGIQSAEEVRRELMAKNPDLRGRTIRAFRWVRPEGKLLEEGKYASSVVVSFEKEEDARQEQRQQKKEREHQHACIGDARTAKTANMQTMQQMTAHAQYGFVDWGTIETLGRHVQ